MIKYLAAVKTKIKILWCYLLWYLFFVVKYFDTDLYLWGCSLGISILVGFALNINAHESLWEFLKFKDKWKTIRFFIIPFCVSSFPAVIKGKGFILFFSPKISENIVALLFCCLFWTSTYFFKKIETNFFPSHQ